MLTAGQAALKELHALSGLDQVEKKLAEFCCGTDNQTPVFAQTVLSGGKRLRPALVLLCGSFGTVSKDKLIDVAVAAELIHTASLIHDDVIDCAQTRRGNPTISHRFGTEQAVLYGDFLFARSFSLLTECGHADILANMTRAISLMCQGEIEQYARLYDCGISQRDYMSYIHKKTAYFLSACCLGGAQAGKLEQVQQKCLAAFGLQLGYAFQITDDLLDIVGKTENTGKPVMQDLREGYLTLPVIGLLHHPEFGKTVREIIEKRDFSEENLYFFRSALEQSGIIYRIKNHVQKLVSKAKGYLTKLPMQVEREALSCLADAIIERKS